MADLGFDFSQWKDTRLPPWLQDKKNETDPRQAFYDQITSYGLRPTSPVIIPSDKINRCPTTDSKNANDDAGWWCYAELASELDGSVIAFGSFGSWRDGHGSNHWSSRQQSRMSEEERRAYREATERHTAMREAVIREKHLAAAKEAKRRWDAALHTAETHSYCQAKGIKPNADQARVCALTGKLLVPAYYNGELCSLQRIQHPKPENGETDKKFIKGSRTDGAYQILYKSPLDTPVYIAEGLATGLTVSEATGCETWNAFNAGNLGKVACIVRSMYPVRQIIIAGDNDHKNKENTGRESAIAAASLVGGVAIIPPQEEGKTDWNDHGVEVARKHLVLKKEEKKVSKSDTALAGLITNTVNWIDSCAFKAQPELTLLNVLCAIAASTNRAYELERFGTKINIYGIGIAPTGMGKDNSRGQIKNLMREAGLEEFIGSDEIRSGQGLSQHVAQKPSMVCMVDEIGMLMKSVGSKNAQSYQTSITGVLTKLWSSSGSMYVEGNLKGDQNQPIAISEPHLCLFGTTTLETYAEAMKQSSISSGELNRFIVKKSKTDFPLPNLDVMRTKPPENVVNAWASLKNPQMSEPIKVKINGMIDHINRITMDEHNLIVEHTKNGIGGVFSRKKENTLKIAMILAVARNPREPVLEEDIMLYAEEFINESLNFIVEFANSNMFEDENHKACLKVLDCIKKNGGQMARSKVMYHLHLSKKQMDEVQDTLGIENGSGKLIFNHKERPLIYTLSGT